MTWTPPEVAKTNTTPVSSEGWTPPEVKNEVASPIVDEVIDLIPQKEITFKPNVDFYKASRDVIPSYTDQIKDLADNEAVHIQDSHNKLIKAEANAQHISTITGWPIEDVKEVTKFDEFVKSLNPRKVTPQESYAAAPIRGLYESIGNALETVGGAIDKFSESLGFDPPSNGIISEAGKWYKDSAKNLKATPDNAVGDMAQNFGSIAGTIAMSRLMPVIATPGLTFGGVVVAKTIPKFPLFLGVEKSLNAYKDSNDPLAPVTEFGKGFTEGVKYEMLGVPARAVGNLVERATVDPVLGEVASAVASGLIFGTDATTTEYAETGNINSRTFLANFGIGVGFHTGQIKSKIMEGMQQKAVSNFFNGDPGQIKASIEAPMSKKELRKEAINLRQKAFKTDGQERNQYLLAANMADKTADIKAISDDVALDKEKYIEGINKDNSLTQARKDEAIDLVNRVADYQKSKKDEFDRVQKESATQADNDRKLAEDQLKANKDAELEKAETPEAKTKIKDKFDADSEALKAKKTEDIDKGISDAQTRLNLPKEPEVKIDADTDITLGKIENKEPVTNEFINSASGNLYQEYKGLEIMKSSDLRKFTIEQIEAKQKELGEQITELENYKTKQAEESKFITDKTEVKPEEVIQATETPIKDQVITKPTEDGKDNAERQRGQGNQEGLLTPEKDVTIQELPIEEAPIEPTIESKANALADAIQDKRFYKTMDEMMNLKSDIGGVELLKTAWDGSLNIASEVIRTGGKVAQAVVNAIEHLKGTDWYRGLSDPSKKIAESKLREEIKGRIEDGKQIRAEAKLRIRQEKLDAKKTRSKLPSENPVKKVQLSEIAGLKDQIKLEAKSAIGGARSVKEGLYDLGVQIKEIFKEYNTKSDIQKITGGQYRSIMNRLATATSDVKVENILDYVYKVLDGAEYKKELGIAKGIVKNVASHNTLRKGIFGTAKETGDLLQKMNVKEMTVEELAEFNAMGNSLIVKDAIDIPRMNEMLVKFSGFIEDVAKIKRVTTHDQLKTAIDKAIGGIYSIKSMGDYLKIQRSLDNATQKIGDMLLQGPDVMSAAQADALRENLEGKSNLVGGVARGYEEQLAEFKAKYLNEIDAARKAVDKAQIEKLSPEVGELVTTILGAKKEDISNLNATDIDLYYQTVKNIKEGAFTSESASLFQKLDAQKLKRMQTDPAIQRINGRNMWTKFMKGKTEGEVLRWIRSKSPRFVEQFFGNDNKSGTLSSIMAGVGNAFNKMNAFKDPVETSLIDIHTALVKGVGNKEARDTERKYMGMFLAEASSRSKFIDTPEEFSLMNYSFGENFGKAKGHNNDPVEMTSRKMIYEKMMSDARNAGATKMLNDVEVIDIPKFEKVIMTDQRRAKYINDIRVILGQTKGMAEASMLLNGRTFIDEGDRYMPLMAFGKSGFINDEVLAQTLNYGVSGIKMEANATNARTNKVFVVEIDPIEIMRAHVNEVSRNYFVMPKLKSSNEAIKLSTQEVANENLAKDKENDNGILMLGRAYQKSMVSRTAFTLNGRHRAEYSNVTKTFDQLLSARKKGLISNPIRIVPEMTSNILRGNISSGAIISNTEYLKNRDTYQSLINEYFGGREMSRWGDEATKSIFKRGFKNKLEKGATSIVTFSDTSVGSRLFAAELNKEFTRLTGNKFDAEKFRDDPAYKESVKEDVEQSAFWGLRRTEELFNNKNVMSQPELTTFIAGIIKGDPSHVSTKIFDMLQGFNRNEFDQMRISWSRLRSGDQKQKMMGARDMVAIPLSNFTYMQVRIATNIIFKAGVAAALGAQLSQSDKKKIDDLVNPEAIAKNFGGSLIALSMGGSQNAYQIAIKAGTILANSAGVDPKATEWIYQYMQDELYIMAVPAYGSQQQILSSAFPVPVLLDDFMQTGKAAGAFCSAVKAAFDDRRITEEQYLKIVNGINIGMLYAYPNPASGLIQNQLRPFIMKAEKAAQAIKKNGKSTVPDYLQEGDTQKEEIPDYLKQGNDANKSEIPDYLK